MLVLVVSLAPMGGAFAGHAALPSGRDTSVPYLAENAIHADGETIAFPADVLAPNSDLTLLGRTPRGWAVEDHQISDTDPFSDLFYVYLVTSAGTTRILNNPGDGGFSRFALSTGGRRILLWDSLDEDTSLEIYDLDGTSLARQSASRIFELLDFDGFRVLFSTGNATRQWRIASNVKRSASGQVGVFGNLGSGTLMLHRQRSDRQSAWTSLAHPKTTRWQARFAAETLNDTTRRVVGRRTTDNAIQVRRISDGKVLRTITPSDIGTGLALWSIDAVWENTSHVLFPVYDATGGFLVRCDLSTHCRQASPHYTGGHGTISIPGIRPFISF